jgi:hypothetical protein
MSAQLHIILLALATICSRAATLEWNANAETNLAGYRVYVGEASRAYTQSWDVGTNTTLDLSWMRHARRLAVTAFDAGGNESDFSEEVSYAPQLMQVRVHIAGADRRVELFYSYDLVTWHSAGLIDIPLIDAPAMFFAARSPQTTPTDFGSKRGKL